MKIKVDVGVASLSKKGEEVCGDTTQVIENKDATTVILSDGLGSGIKASILSILSTQIATRLFKARVGMEQVFTTIADTLPICQKRRIAYSTLSILKISRDGRARLIEYDNPSLLLIRDENLQRIEKRKKIIAEKEVYVADFQVKLGDIILLVSDGVINAGVGGLFQLGLGEDRLLENIFKRNWTKKGAQGIADKIIGLTEACYLGKPGDDSTCIALKAREPRSAVVMTGPPAERKKDREVVERFLSFDKSIRIVCGGATGKMVAREMDEEIETSLEYIDPSVPPTANIKGVDLVTEGILTLNKCLDKLKSLEDKQEISTAWDGASKLAHLLISVDEVTFLMGSAVNPAHEDLMNSLQLKLRPVVVGKLVNILRGMGKDVIIETY